MSHRAVPFMVLVVLAGTVGASTDTGAASWEIGWSYAPEITSREPHLWEYAGQRMSVGIVDFVTPNMQLGGHISYGRYRYDHYGVICHGDLPTWREDRPGGTEGALDLDVILRAVPPPENQRVREFLFFSYSLRLMESRRDALDEAHLFTFGFGGLVRLGKGTRLLLQAGPTFDWDMSYGTLPVSLMLQYGSP